jgi:O-antigen ligase
MAKKTRTLHYCIYLLLFFIFFLIPIEHKYDKLFRYYSLTLIPDGLEITRFFYPKIYFYISDLIGVVLFAVGIWQIRKQYQERGSLFLALLFLGAIFSIIASPFSSYPVAYIRLLQFFTPLALFFFLANNPQPKERLFKIFTWALFGIGLIEGCISIAQYFKQAMLGLRILGEQPLLASIPVTGGHRWLFDLWFQQSLDSPTIYRAMGTMPHPNVMGGFLAVTLFITSYLFLIHQKRRLWLGLAYLILFFSMAITYSRSAIFAYIISTLLWMTWMRCRKKIAVQSVAILIVVSSAIVGILLHEQIYSRGGVVNYNHVSRSSDQERLFYQDIAFKMIRQHPFLGVGYGQFASQAAPFIPPGTDLSKISFSYVHNIFLLVATEMGLFSLAIFFLWAIMMVRCGWRSFDASPETALLWSIFIGFLFIGCCDYYPIVLQQGKILFFGIAGLLARFGCFEKKTKTVAVTSTI